MLSLIPNKEQKIKIFDQPVIKIGRSRSCDVVLGEPDISTVHCELNLVEVDLDGDQKKLYNIVDRSRNGTFINGNRLMRKDYLLRNGDRIVFGKSASFLFKYVHVEACEQPTDSPARPADEEKNSVFKKPLFSSQNTTRKPLRGKENRGVSFFDRYIPGKELGSGHYAIVKEAINKITGQSVAVKIFHPQKNDDAKKTRQFREETKILMGLNHENIVKLLERFVEPLSKSQVQTYLVLEKIQDGELFDRIVRKTKLQQDETRALFKQILAGLKYLHDRNIIHRDIKPENILLSIRRRTSPDQVQLGPWDEDELDITVKIADFGLAKFTGEMQFTTTLCGTPSYVAAEVLTKTGYTSKVDLWSAGVLLYVCLCGFPPFSDQLAPPSMKEQILQGKFAFYSPYWDEIDDSVLHLISNLLVVDPAKRYSVRDAIGHEWLTKTDDSKTSKVERPRLSETNVPKTYSELSSIQQTASK
ncbi:AFL188Cp [Eremothecium gossypii ATCC 10895]|uniref:AFL188Cp n=1 Tax=Eremothecium gossypii (strain ATCC 10895 / CBS 109.51 / FGSC 9923 / NRRL Y-1056) TaxID=284811 RepID=Q755K5_EREGS|nr:AFL188Cp [Eremothecium gossypii ATCC 10895]AAS53186.2 AFL188Cp [Eremothecium gossypii ATCC 10895]AEY97496.1 FAFL188Cp [Eremothecium gossypii FDAG1]